MKLIDLHCDTIMLCMEDGAKYSLLRNGFCVDIEKLKKANSIAQVFALYVSLKSSKEPYRECLAMADKFYAELDKNKSDIAFAGSYGELLDNIKSNKLSAFLSIEEGGVLKGDINNLYTFYDLGVRLITLIWNYPNELGYPNFKFEHQDKGLTEFGIEVVREMNRLGMFVDVSHASDKVFYDVAALSTAPFVASHSNARELKHHARNLTDDMIRLLADKGGVTGINFEAWFLGEGDEAKLSDIVRHIKYIHKVGGSEVLAIGSDFDGTTHTCEIKDIGQMEKLYEALKKNGFSEGDIDKIFYKNAIRIIKDVLK